MKRYVVAILLAGLIVVAWLCYRGAPTGAEPSAPGERASPPVGAKVSQGAADESSGTRPSRQRSSAQAIPPPTQRDWTPEQFTLLPVDQREYTPTSRARAKWMSLHAFPTAESLARSDEDRLRDEADHCNRQSANTLIEKLRQRGSEDWRPLAEFEAIRGSLFAARAVMKDEIAKRPEQRDMDLIVRMTTIVVALGGTGVVGNIAATAGSRSLPDVDWQRAAGVMESVHRDLDWWESHSRTKPAEHFARNPCTVVRAIEPPHPWTAGMADFFKRHPQYN